MNKVDVYLLLGVCDHTGLPHAYTQSIAGSFVPLHTSIKATMRMYVLASNLYTFSALTINADHKFNFIVHFQDEEHISTVEGIPIDDVLFFPQWRLTIQIP